MKQAKKKLLAKVAYLYYVENKTQAEIAQLLGIYRTTVSRLLTQARTTGIVKIEIADFNMDVFQLEEYLRTKYQLRQVEIATTDKQASEQENAAVLADCAASFLKNLVRGNQTIGITWGATLSSMVDRLECRSLSNMRFCPLAGGPSYINTKYHVNTLVYELARKLRGKSVYLHVKVVQETPELIEEIKQTTNYQQVAEQWQNLDIALVGIGGTLDQRNSQWRDLLTMKDYQILADEKAVGECACRFFNQDGQLIHTDLQERIVGIPLQQLCQIPYSVAIASGTSKAQAILAMLRKKYINCLVSDQQTMLSVLQLDGDKTFTANQSGIIV